MIRLHRDDFIEMLERDDPIERIAAYCGVQIDAVLRRFARLEAAEKNRIIRKRKNRPSLESYAKQGADNGKTE